MPYACFHFLLDGKEYPDDLGKSISFEDFYQMIADGAQPTTAQVNIDQYINLFEPILKEGRDVLHLALSSGISGTVNSANMAKTQMEEKYPERKVVVIDSLAASSGFGLLVDKALENQEKGMSLEENARWKKIKISSIIGFFPRILPALSEEEGSPSVRILWAGAEYLPSDEQRRKADPQK